jgi:hypothetical protein
MNPCINDKRNLISLNRKIILFLLFKSIFSNHHDNNIIDFCSQFNSLFIIIDSKLQYSIWLDSQLYKLIPFLTIDILIIYS